MPGRVEPKSFQTDIEPVGAGGEVGQGQSGQPLHKPHGVRDREIGDRERVGSAGPIGNPKTAENDRNSAFDRATRELIREEIERGDANPTADPDQKDET
jgi:hypothetical protein